MKRLQPYNNDFCRLCQLGVYQTLVVYEKRCSERHNRFFSVLGLIGTGVLHDRVVLQLKNHLRSSDFVFLFPQQERDQQKEWRIGILLPQTDPQGVAAVKKRLIQLCDALNIPIRIGSAVYPDDGTSPDELLFKAFLQSQPNEDLSRSDALNDCETPRVDPLGKLP
jgi:hypothetical protein